MAEQTVEELRRTPLDSVHEVAGAKMVPFAGWRMPLQYDGIIAEHMAVRERAGLFDVSHMGQFLVSGPAAVAALQGVLSNDLARIPGDGSAQYTMLLDDDGGIEDDLIAYRTGEDELLLVVNAANRTHDLELIRAAVGTAGEVDDVSDLWAMFALQGPRAMDVLGGLGSSASSMPRFHFAVEALGEEQIGCIVATTGYTGEDGVEILVSVDDATELWGILIADELVTPCGLGARDTLRLEACYPLHGNDIHAGTDPISAGLAFAAPNGLHDSIDRIRVAGPRRKLVPLLVDGRGIPRPGTPVLDSAGTEIGAVTSGTMSPVLRAGIALAWIDASHAQLDAAVTLDIRGTHSSARVVRRPFVTGSL